MRVRNRLDFVPLDRFVFSWELTADGVVEQSGPLPGVDAAPGQDSLVPIPIRPFDPLPGVEYFVTVRARTAAPWSLLPAGFEVAWEQLPWSSGAASDGATTTAERAHPGAALSLIRDAERIAIRGDGFDLQFDAATGTLDVWTVGGRDLVRTGPAPNFWRAPTDNDHGAGMPRWEGRWRDAGATRQVESVNAEQISPARVRVEVDTSLPQLGSRLHTIYDVHADGTVRIWHSFTPGAATLPELPRFGLSMTLPARLSQMRWLGRGPQESYADRKSGAPIGLYEGTVADQHHPYVRPQETGNKTDVRWLELIDGSGFGLRVEGEQPLSVSAWPYALADIENASGDQRHSTDVVVRDFITLNVDLRQMGVGGDNSWGARPRPGYLIAPAPMAYGFWLIPIRPN